MKTFRTSREILASTQDVFAAISDPQRLARWWGPNGFTNTFHSCELTIGLDSTPAGTRVSWSQAFENAEVASKIEHIVVPANEQNLERLAAEVLSRT